MTTAISEELSDERLARVLTSLPPNDRPDGYPRQTQVQVAWLRTILTELLALRSGNGGEVRVKALEWKQSLSTVQHAFTTFGLFYGVEVVTGGWVLTKHEGSSQTKSFWGNEAEAKAAAQADYETRIRSALDIKP